MNFVLARVALMASLFAWFSSGNRAVAGQTFFILKPSAFEHHVQKFNSMEDENVTNFIPNRTSWPWLSANIPLFECPDSEVEELYYYRWWSLRKHIEKFPSGFVLNEFLTRKTPVSSALGHQINELRWLRDPVYVEDYIRYWLKEKEGKAFLHKYSSWLAYAVYQRYLVAGDKKFPLSLLGDLADDYHKWEEERLTTNGLFYQFDVRDAMEESISGSRTNKNLRPSINSYMYGNAVAISAIAGLAGNASIKSEFDAKAADLKRLINSNLWDSSAEFFKVRLDNDLPSDAREEIGFIPWYFGVATNGQQAAWIQATNHEGFSAPFGFTTAERRHPRFRTHGCCHCEWDGAVWPFATSQTLTAMANFMDDYDQSVLSKQDYFDCFMTYARSQHAHGKPYIGEYLDEVTGQWYNGRDQRSRYYNHSTFVDLLITGLIGLRPESGPLVKVSPLMPEEVWDWFCLDGVPYHGHLLSFIWDRTGAHYQRGSGWFLFCDGRQIAHKTNLKTLNAALP